MAAFADGIIVLAESGCDIIVDDIIYLLEAMFQDDLVALAVNFGKCAINFTPSISDKT